MEGGLGSRVVLLQSCSLLLGVKGAIEPTVHVHNHRQPDDVNVCVELILDIVLLNLQYILHNHRQPDDTRFPFSSLEGGLGSRVVLLQSCSLLLEVKGAIEPTVHVHNHRQPDDVNVCVELILDIVLLNLQYILHNHRQPDDTRFPFSSLEGGLGSRVVLLQSCSLLLEVKGAINLQ